MIFLRRVSSMNAKTTRSFGWVRVLTLENFPPRSFPTVLRLWPARRVVTFGDRRSSIGMLGIQMLARIESRAPQEVSCFQKHSERRWKREFNYEENFSNRKCWVGSHLSEALLRQKYEVICLNNFNDYYNNKFKWLNITSMRINKHYKLVEGDILDLKLLRSLFAESSIDIVVHLAARAGVRPSIEGLLARLAINLRRKLPRIHSHTFD